MELPPWSRVGSHCCRDQVVKLYLEVGGWGQTCGGGGLNGRACQFKTLFYEAP